MKNILIVIIGPTGIGKTGFSIGLAHHLNCEIISADSRQFFKDLKIGAAPPSKEQLMEIRHHFVGFLSLDQYYSASIFEQDVLLLLKDIFENNQIAILTGGSTLYVDAICNGIDDIPDVDPGIRQKYMAKYRDEGIESLRVALKLMDPVHYNQVDLKNHKRIIRALEICESTGRPYSSFLSGKKKTRDFNILKVGLRMDRAELYDRINKRVDQMIEAGLENEALSLLPKRHLNSLETVGYKEFFGFFDGKYDRDFAIELIKRNSRRYAKRQITWWAKDKTVKWFNCSEDNDFLGFIDNELSTMKSTS